MASRKESYLPERRLYKRLDHVFPVEFQYADPQKQPRGGWRQGFTQDIGRGGLCLTVNQLTPEDIGFFSDAANTVFLNIHIPLKLEAVRAAGHPVWLKCLKEGLINQYMVGISYETIAPHENARMVRYADVRHFLKALALTLILFLSVGLGGASFYNTSLHYQNEKLLADLSETLSRQRNLISGGDLLKLKISEMEFLLSQAGRKIETLERRLLFTRPREEKFVTELKSSIDFFKQYQINLKEELSSLKTKKTQVDDARRTMGEEATVLERKVLEKFTDWLRMHQRNQTGLIPSFEGDGDVGDWAFTYDQALAVIAFVRSGEGARAVRILDFYLAAPKINDGAFANAYYASDCGVAEAIAHAGPNIWLGIAALQYTQATRDNRYLPLAVGIARWLDTIKDTEGGLKGGATVTWYSTEHNLDAYAFYRMFYQLTQEEYWRREAEKSLSWLGKNAYSKISEPFVKRGKGDSTVATDTFAWSIAAVGPEGLSQMGMDPDEILDFAVSQCGVSVEYKKPEGYLLAVKGFDFAKNEHLARGGVVSCEWTAQMILAFKIMAAYHRTSGDETKADHYGRLAHEYTAELNKMVVTSPSPVGQGAFCLPYASHEFADTGHGWRTPKGNRTGSVAATAYAILAMEGFNPLALE